MTDPTTDPTTDRGTYLEHHGRPAVRFVRTYPHPVAAVWAAVTEQAQLAHWFPSTLAIETREGGTVVFAGDPNGPGGTGTVLAWEPPRRVAFTWGDDELHLTVEPCATGTVLTLVDVLPARDTAARTAAGWTVCLAELDKHLAGEVADGPHSATATPWRPVYEAYLADGMPAGAGIPGSPT